MEERMVVDAQDLYYAVLEELPNKRGAVYYALSMVLEMIEHMKEPITETKEEEVCDTGCEECKSVSKDFEIVIEAHGVEDLRNQIINLLEFTYSEEFDTYISMGKSFEYSSCDKAVRFDLESEHD